MGRAKLAISTNGGVQFKQLVAKLKTAGEAEIKRDLNKAVREAASPVVADLRAAYLKLPDKSPARRRDGRSLRKIVAAAVGVSIRADGVRILVKQSKLPADFQTAAHAIESKKGHRHPVFARPTQTRSQWTWVTQAPSGPVFNPTMYRNRERFRAAVHGVMEDTFRRIQ